MKIKAKRKFDGTPITIVDFCVCENIIWAVGVDEDGDIDGYSVDDVKIIDEEYHSERSKTDE